jgi:long-chain fatty acid transport protein
MIKSFPLKLGATCALLCSMQLYAGAFSLYTEGSASAVGNFAAGIAAEGRDASVGWYNPAALVLLKRPELLAGLVGVSPSATLSGQAYFYQQSQGVSLPPYIQNFSHLSGAREAIVPNIHIALPAGDKVTYGLSVVAPMGMSTSWPEDSALRYAGTLSSLRMVDISPEMGGYITQNFSVGWGLDIEIADVDFNNILGAPAAFQFLGQDPTSWDSKLINHGTSSGLGFHGGFLLLSSDKRSRFGFNYQYGVTHEFSDSSRLEGRLADPQNLQQNPKAVFLGNNLRSNPIKFPDIMTFSLYHQVSDKIAMMGSYVYTLWSPFKTIELFNVAAYSVPEDSLFFTNASSVQNFHNASRVAVGLNMELKEDWQLRLGGGYDQTPTNNIDRDTRLPDVDKYALAVGLQWKYNPHLRIDAGYSYLFPASDISIQKTQVLDADNSLQVFATGRAHAQLLAIQAAWRQ